MQQRDTKKNKFVRITATILFAVGLILFFYPIVSNVLYVIESNNRFSKFEQQIEDIKNNESSSEQPSANSSGKGESQNDESDNSSKNESSVDEQPQDKYSKEYLSELYKKMKSYNEDLFKAGQPKLTDPFSYEQSPFDLTEYGMSDNMIGYIDIPKMEQKLPLMLGATWDNMGQGAAYMANTSLPIGGENTNCVIAGHRGMTYALMFRYIEWLENGDDVYIKNLWETLHYKVTKIEIIDPTDIDKIRIQKGKDMVTLITCHPYPYNYQRYVVYCERVDDSEPKGENSNISENTSGSAQNGGENSNAQSELSSTEPQKTTTPYNTVSLEQLELVIQITVIVLLVSFLVAFVAAKLIRRRRNKK